MQDWAADLQLIIDAAREAGALAQQLRRDGLDVQYKEGDSPVTNADLATDALIKQRLTTARPDYGWLSEEATDDHRRFSSRRTFVVDPIDGTRGFLDGSSTWCVSVAVVDAGQPVAGVLECPARSETFSASAGGRARCNGKVIRVREAGEHPEVSGNKPMIDAMPLPWRDSFRRVAYVPSLAYRIAQVAAGNLDATFIKQDSHDWDLAAADLILSRAGGALVTLDGEPLSYNRPTVSHETLAAAGLSRLSGLVEASRHLAGH